MTDMTTITCTLTGTGELPDILLPVSSFSLQIESDGATRISVVVPSMSQAEDIADRAAGDLVLAMNGIVIGTEALSDIRTDEGAHNQSITLQAVS
ncbi:MAG: hypothetical protein V1844_09945 [Pseudomonadota bacterium]